MRQLTAQQLEEELRVGTVDLSTVLVVGEEEAAAHDRDEAPAPQSATPVDAGQAPAPTFSANLKAALVKPLETIEPDVRGATLIADADAKAAQAPVQTAPTSPEG